MLCKTDGFLTKAGRIVHIILEASAAVQKAVAGMQMIGNVIIH